MHITAQESMWKLMAQQLQRWMGVHTPAHFAGDLVRPERVAAAAAADDVAMAGPTAAAALAAEKHWWVYSKQNEPPAAVTTIACWLSCRVGVIYGGSHCALLLLGIVTALLHLILLRVHC
jgi:hypothetical protein